MNPDVLQDFVSITANILTLSAAIGLLFGIIVRPHRERANWVFALFLATLALWAYATLMLRIPHLNLFSNKVHGFYLHMTGLGLTPITFYYAVMAFGPIQARPARLFTRISLVGAVVFLILLWGNQIATVHAESLAPDAPFNAIVGNFDVLPLGYLALAFIILHIVVAYYYLRATGDEQSKALEIPALLLLVGYAGNFVEPISRLPFDSTLVTIAAVLMGYTFINRQIFNPLQNMNKELSDTNRELRTTIAELAHAQDRTQKLNEELRAASQYKSDFLAKMSHELRTPLNSIVGYSELLTQELYGPLTAKQSDRLEKIHRNGRDLLALINDILDLSKIEAGRLELSPEHMDITETITGLASTIEPMVREKGLDLVIDVAADIYPLYADPLRIRQILTNLMSNAVKFTHEGLVKLEAFNVEVTQGQSQEVDLPALGWLSDGHWVLLRVTDTGIGIAPEHHATIFDEFRQVDDTSTREFGGTGLGLAITMKLVKMHGGHIWLKSALGQGSTFFAALPASSKVTARPAQETARPADGQTGAHVLIIDDSKEAADILSAYLQEGGYSVTRASSGETGIRLAHELKPAVITTDILMPGLNGWEVIERLKADPETASIPVIVVSIVDAEPKSFSLGASAHISKPVRWEDLLQVIGRFQAAGQELPVLVVDDNPDDREIVAQILRTAHYAVQTCGSGAEALDWLKHSRASLVLLDLLMPEVSGFDVLNAIRARPELDSLPVLIVSAKELTAAEESFLNGRIADIVKKQDIASSDLLARMARILQ